MTARRFLPGLATFSLLLACDPPPPIDDAGTDAAVGPCETAPPAFEHGGDGHPEPLGSAAGEVRAGRADAADLPASGRGLETWSDGDFILANDRIAIVIEDAGPSDLYDRFGGRPVGVSRVEGGAIHQAADFNEVLFGVSTFLVLTDRVSVLADGSTGTATIRASGPLGPIDFAGSLLNAFNGGNFEGEQAAVDYTLSPGSDSVEVTLHVANSQNRLRTATRMLMGFFQDSRMPMYVPGMGFGEASGEVPWLGFDDEHDGAGWAWVAPPDRDINAILTTSGVGVADLGRAPIQACTVTSIPLGRIVIGDGLAGAQAAIARLDGTALRTLTGRVTEADGTTAAGDVRVHVEIDGAYYTRVPVAADGSYALELPAAGAARVRAYRRGFDLTTLDVPGGADPVANLSMPAFGSIHVTATEGGAPLPARIQVFPTSGAAFRAPANYAERAITSGRVHVEFPTNGEATVRVPPGTYRVVTSRGYEYELEESPSVVVASGATVDVAAALRRSVESPGVVCADYHIHTTRSPDAPDDARLKVASLVADGLEIAVRSEHEFIADFQPVVESLGVQAFVRGLAGEELTTFEWGHFGVFPVTVDPDAPSGGAVPWVGRRPPAVFADVRARPEAPAFIVNHPRSTSIGQGYFEIVGFDPTTGAIDNPSDWDEDFTIVEAFNDSSFDQNRDGTVRDWFAFLAQGRRIFVVGSSDSHSLYSAPVGYPRTCLDLGIDDPATVTPTAVRDATIAGHAVVSGGITMTVEGPGGEGPGDDASGVGPTAMVHVTIRAAEWVGVESLEVIVDGTTTETIALTRDTVDPTLLLDEMVAVPVAASAMGSYAVFHAFGTEPMADLHPGRVPFAVSNPIFFTR